MLNGITGSTGLAPTLAALEAGSILALANKESLVVGGPLVTGGRGPGQIVAVDSEHSALAQCLRGGTRGRGRPAGPDRERRTVPRADAGRRWPTSRPPQALAHPTWDMGRVITTNSATLVNKGLELLEAHLLYGVDLDRIDVVVHPQSIVHSMVQFVDGSTLAQCSPPDMKLPDRARPQLAGPDAGRGGVLRLVAAATWTFEPLDARGLPGRRAGPDAPAGSAAPRPRSTTRPTRSASTPSTTAGSAFLRHRGHRRAPCSTSTSRARADRRVAAPT